MAKWTERFDVRTVADFAAVWLAVGFAAGTMTLLGPVRWITTALRDVATQTMAHRKDQFAATGAAANHANAGVLRLVRHRIQQRFKVGVKSADRLDRDAICGAVAQVNRRRRSRIDAQVVVVDGWAVGAHYFLAQQVDADCFIME